MNAYSLDLRERVVAAYEKGNHTIAEVAAQFSVGETFLKKMLRQKRQTGSLERLPQRAGAKKVLNRTQRLWLAKQIKEQPDATLVELQTSLLEQQQQSVSPATLSRELQQLRLGRKKNRSSLRTRNNGKRGWFWRKMKKIAHERLKFIDESGITTILTRLFGRAAPGIRVREAVPKNYGQSTSVVSLIGLGGVETTMLVEGAVDTLAFDAFGENFVRPCLRTGDVLVLDNLGAHRASRIEQIAESCGAKVIWLPPYSPDFSPIEQMWSKLKTYLRKVKARTSEELDRAVAEGLQLITENDCRGWFKHCGYQVA